MDGLSRQMVKDVLYSNQGNTCRGFLSMKQHGICLLNFLKALCTKSSCFIFLKNRTFLVLIEILQDVERGPESGEGQLLRPAFAGTFLRISFAVHNGPAPPRADYGTCTPNVIQCYTEAFTPPSLV